MKVNEIKDIKKFLSKVESLNGEVYFVEGKSKLSLKSKLCRLIFVAKHQNNEINDAHIEFEDKDEEEYILGELENGRI